MHVAMAFVKSYEQWVEAQGIQWGPRGFAYLLVVRVIISRYIDIQFQMNTKCDVEMQF